MASLADKLAETPLGLELGGEHTQALAHLMNDRSLAAEELLFEKGAAGDAVFVVLTGELQVLLDDDLAVAVLGPGSVVGELEALTGGRRVASVKATAPSVCLELPASALRDRSNPHPDAIDRFLAVMAKVLAVRLAAINDKVVAAWRLTSQVSEESSDEIVAVVHDVLDDVWQ